MFDAFRLPTDRPPTFRRSVHEVPCRVVTSHTLQRSETCVLQQNFGQGKVRQRNSGISLDYRCSDFGGGVCATYACVLPLLILLFFGALPSYLSGPKVFSLLHHRNRSRQAPRLVAARRGVRGALVAVRRYGPRHAVSLRVAVCLPKTKNSKK